MSHPQAQFDPVAFCSRPLVRQGYLALTTGLAVFIATLAILREPFRGYLAEVHVEGPTAKGLDLNAAARWLKQMEPGAVVLTGPTRGPTDRSRIRMTYLAARPNAATLRLDDLATRWLYQYLPEQMQAHRRRVLAEVRNSVTVARDREDEARTRVEVLRQKQLAQYFHQPSFPPPETAAEELPPLQPAAGPLGLNADLRGELDKLRLELARLLASFTDEHPQVIALRKQIAGLEQQLGLPVRGEGPELAPTPPPQPQAREAAAGHFVSTATSSKNATRSPPSEPADISGEISAALLELTQASRQRQVAEQRQSDRMQELSSEPTAADWSAEPAQVVTRLGGTPRMVTLALGGLLAGVAAVAMFRSSAVAVLPPKIQSARELAAVLEIPVVGNAARLRTAAARIRQRLLKPAYVRLAGRLAEAVLAVAAAACLLSITVEPTLAGQVLADPFGTLSEVVGRFAASR